jgi:hypothetical protein
MKKTLLLLFLFVALGTSSFAQDLSNCKKTCTQEKLVETGAFLGVRIITADNHTHAKVLEVVPNTSAERNNLAIGDVITKIDGITVKGRLHIMQIIKAHEPNDLIKIEYVHNNKTKKKRVFLGALQTKVITETICCDELETKSAAANGLMPVEIRYVLYPNPAVNTLQITSDLQVSGPVQIGIYDMLGSELMSTEINSNKDILNQHIDLKNFATGSYLVKITNNNVVSVSKLVITK